jgi:hypothetical protein
MGVVVYVGYKDSGHSPTEVGEDMVVALYAYCKGTGHSPTDVGEEIFISV